MERRASGAKNKGERVRVPPPALRSSQSEVDVMKKQLDGLTREYDRLLKEHQELQVTSRCFHFASVIIKEQHSEETIFIQFKPSVKSLML